MTGYESKKAMAQDKITDEQGRPMTYWGGKAQPAQEPVAKYSDIVSDGGLDPRNTAPPQRPWVGLTDEEIKAVNAQVSQIPPIDYTTTTYAKAIEAKLKEKNNGA